jgi:Cu(I)/Ag(I) efflux system membrane fusion protein
METQLGAKKSGASFVAGVIVGLLAGAAALYAHFSGFLTPMYHAVGLHSMAKQSEQHGHAGHEEMPEMPGMSGMKMSGKMEQAEPSEVSGYSIVKITPDRQQLIGIRTGKVERDRLLMSIRTVGIIEPDQTRLSRVHTRISGWATKVHANFVGQNVEKGDPLLEIYSPDLLATQQEYLIARSSLEATGMGQLQSRLADSSRRRLELWGVPEDEILELERTKKARDTLTLRSHITGRILERNLQEGSYVEPAMELYRIADLSMVWLQAKIYEHELPHIELNQPVHVTLPSQPGEQFQGKVSFIEPVLQEMTRTVKVRVEIDNAKDLLKPGMYADLKIEHDMGEGLLVLESAVLRTGERAIAFRVLPEGRFEPVEVKLGSRFEERFEVLGGLEDGDEVVTSGNFLIDSDSRLKSATGAMGHQH